MGVAPEELPYLKLPHHTIIELTPGPFGTEVGACVRACVHWHHVMCL